MTVEEIAREAFKAGWKERNRSPGLKKVVKRSLNNAIISAVGGSRHMDTILVPDDRKYHNSIWIHSDLRKQLFGSAKP